MRTPKPIWLRETALGGMWRAARSQTAGLVSFAKPRRKGTRKRRSAVEKESWDGVMVYVFYGEESLLVREELSRLRETLGDAEMLSLNTTVLDGAKVTLAEVQAAADTVPFLAPARLVIVEGLLARFEPFQGATRRRGRDAAGEWARLTEYLPGVPETSHLVFLDGALTARNPLLPIVRPGAQVVEHRKLRGTNLEEWVRQRAASRGVAIAQPAVRLLLQTAGDDLWVLSSELEKLSVYARDRAIEAEDVDRLVAQARESNIFALIDAVAARQLGGAQRALHSLLDGGAVPGYVLTMLGREFRVLLLAVSYSARGEKGDQLMARLGIPSAWALQRTMERTRGYNVGTLKVALGRVLATDVLIKTGKQDAEIALDLLVADLCQKA